jgi:hypothetical protein
LRWRSLIVSSIVVAGLMLTPSGALAIGASCGWSIDQSGSVKGGVLLDVSALSATSVWAVGRIGTGRPKTLVEHFDGTGWHRLPSPSPTGYDDELYGVAPVAENDVWAVGASPYSTSSSLIEHWDGTSWSLLPPPAGVSGSVNGVSADSATDVWAVGDLGGVVLRWDGTAWSTIPLPDTHIGLEGVAAISPTDVWAVGHAGGRILLLHWDGAGFSMIRSNGGNLLAVDALSSDDLWTVGGYGGVPIARHWNGVRFKEFALPATNEWTTVDDVAASSHSDVWAAGYDMPEYRSTTLLYHTEGSAWTVVSSPSVPDADNHLFGVASDRTTGQAWAVGNYSDIYPRQSSLTLRYEPC